MILGIQVHRFVKKTTWLLLIMCSVKTMYAQTKALTLSPSLVDAYKEITALRMTNGLTFVSIAKLKEPNNALVHYIEDYADFFTIFIGEEKSSYNARIKNRDIRLQKIAQSDLESPYNRFARAEIILHWALLKLKFEDKVSAASDVLDAYNLLVENKKKFPNFIENDKSLCIIHALAESLPNWIRKIVGIKGSIVEANREISALVSATRKSKSIFYEESIAIYSYILFYANNQKEEAFKLYDTYPIDHKRSPLIAFLKSTMALKTGRNEIAMKILSERPTTNEYLPFHYLDFVYGKAKLNRLDRDANVYIERFLNKFKGRHYIREAYQKLAWYQLAILNNQKAYNTTITKCRQYGHELFDEDIQATKESKLGIIPDAPLLKARLLYDGGYYTKARNLVVQIKANYTNAKHDGEYYYRLARIEEALHNQSAAIDNYKLTLDKSDPSKYYACNAALQLGLIHEANFDNTLAQKYFNVCLSLNPAGYASSLHAKAKSGLHRIKSKSKK
jgi:hypothetical protein